MCFTQLDQFPLVGTVGLLDTIQGFAHWLFVFDFYILLRYLIGVLFFCCGGQNFALDQDLTEFVAAQDTLLE